jgi:hypothetical protein
MCFIRMIKKNLKKIMTDNIPLRLNIKHLITPYAQQALIC